MLFTHLKNRKYLLSHSVSPGLHPVRPFCKEASFSVQQSKGITNWYYIYKTPSWSGPSILKQGIEGYRIFGLDRLETPLCAKVSVLINWLIHSQEHLFTGYQSLMLQSIWNYLEGLGGKIDGCEVTFHWYTLCTDLNWQKNPRSDIPTHHCNDNAMKTRVWKLWHASLEWLFLQ